MLPMIEPYTRPRKSVRLIFLLSSLRRKRPVPEITRGATPYFISLPLPSYCGQKYFLSVNGFRKIFIEAIFKQSSVEDNKRGHFKMITAVQLLQIRSEEHDAQVCNGNSNLTSARNRERHNLSYTRTGREVERKKMHLKTAHQDDALE